jgi:hypothetical protein
MEELLREVRFALKMLWKEKTFSTTVLLTLAVCIGANVAIFSVIHTVLLKPLPFKDPDRLVTVREPGRLGRPTAPSTFSSAGSTSRPSRTWRSSRAPEARWASPGAPSACPPCA